MNKVDIAIIGAGPAGLSAAVNAKIRNRSFLLFGSGLSHKINISQSIDNYLGIPQADGKTLNAKFKEHIENMDITITEERITGIYNMGKSFMLLANQKEYEADAIILATGSEMTKSVKGERELLGRGVSYCATCDGNLYKNKTIAVVCDSEELEEEAEYLAELAGYVHYFPVFKSNLSAENLKTYSSRIQSVNGDFKAESITLKSGEELKVDGIFFLKNSVSADVLLHGLETENGHIVVDRNMATSIKGCFAAGDCTGAPYQIAKAAGEGNIALHSAVSYLSKKQ
ncbi:MAG: NAD(P)/FAD-dependent oxidoreductase [Eubacterium sp.]